MTIKQLDRELKKLADQIMADCEKDGEPVTPDEALEMARMEFKAKKVKNYVRSEEAKPKKKRTVKLDEIKVDFINRLKPLLESMEGVENVEITNPQKLISFTMGGDSYDVSLIKHRVKKEK